MRRRAIVLSILSSSAVLAAGWQVGVVTHPQSVSQSLDAAAPATGSTSGSTTGGATAATPTPSSAAAATPQQAAGASGTFTGAAAQTRFGAVQVQITVADGTITDVAALQLTDHDQRSVQISNRAAPVLRQEVLTAQSANVQNVSGATYTSDGYLTSLQSALDQAGL
ncbi:FMN-binding protein [Cryobacterium lactosi]|uniref:FMN-binding protein n=1 Tax=Cryobacterium lactosi TaxID=1259202 RepID=A0A4R9C0D6_9MICO|nr:FMN-binding protein [Cryobacterium lactosi]TFD94839.1 FMN-binding protein [Cryobacterium lactosi]